MMRVSLGLLAAFGLAMCLFATPSYASFRWFPSIGDFSLSHHLFVFLHHLGVIVLMGNVIVSSVWMGRARRTGDRAVLFCASKSIVRADWMFTLPGLFLILVSGVMTIGDWGGFGRASWAELTLAIFVLIVVIWLVFLMRCQRKMLYFTRESHELKIGLSDEFFKIERHWSMWGGVVTFLLLISLLLMVFKPHLWGKV